VPEQPPVVAIEASVPPHALPTTAGYDGTMPDLRGLSLRTAVRALEGCDCALEIDGHGYVVSQKPDPGTALDREGAVTLTLADAEASN